ncbi:MAG: hypothetical protein AVDCRST_MAG50-2338 [uncultured Acidimicrobiales bacterium]|uniref:LysM domain-containing protein n=1 Tax=uncultured Acidimicrobiales bacterium TaxID=310071 RepID=A0A6J4IJX4_9ACTN|nr:MAG: hypothetical protein AVDCRST_MAG50-2338 [uncultured Acidimicrobiales bacterium]
MAAIAFPGPSGAAPRSWEPRLVPAPRPVRRSAPVGGARRSGVGPATYRRRRIVAAIVGVGLLVGIHVVAGVVTSLVVSATSAAASSSTSSIGGPTPPTAKAAERTHVVQPGDTVWGVARRFQPHGDVRPLVDAMVDARGGRPLQVGERLVVP